MIRRLQKRGAPAPLCCLSAWIEWPLMLCQYCLYVRSNRSSPHTLLVHHWEIQQEVSLVANWPSEPTRRSQSWSICPSWLCIPQSGLTWETWYFSLADDKNWSLMKAEGHQLNSRMLFSLDKKNMPHKIELNHIYEVPFGFFRWRWRFVCCSLAKSRLYQPDWLKMAFLFF